MEDHFRFQISLHFSKDRRRNDDNVTEPVKSEIPSQLTWQMIWSLIASIYDPLGFITPVTLGAKVLMRNLCIKYESMPEGKWDTPVDPLLWEETFKLIKQKE